MTDTATPEAAATLDYAYIFRRHFDDGISPSGIGRELHKAYTTIGAILAGDRDAEHTADLRARYPKFVAPWASPFTDDQLASIFPAYWTAGRPLTDIARELLGDPNKYVTIRRVLQGDQDGDRTVELRAEYPPYQWKRGQTSFSDDQLEDIFASYHGSTLTGEPVEQQSMETIAARYKSVRGTIANLIHGRKGRLQTQRLIDYYGTAVRSPGFAGRPDNPEPAS